MKRIVTTPLAATLALLSGSLALAQPLTYQLPDEASKFRDGPNLEIAQNNCTACHSADYIRTQPPKKGQAFWAAEVNKMIKTYKAPIAETDVKAIVEYLDSTY
ncbi:sulfite:cytochrome C oxidoreductase subunit B [Labrys sp. WJW]|uniref:SorB family sulfite dehydrogenase c-type cytochrome subunit n=1 Tax=Labrys sp. WJW TaxID=1737983 RepID=UPI00082F70AB|nr:sulfite:cytochrome C oxidoreductase subunit B [Labrys sp. WJW]OCC00422.1 sulfite:cytochrome C oxidoreductase subunit B [Labrys sp. WJW]